MIAAADASPSDVSESEASFARVRAAVSRPMPALDGVRGIAILMVTVFHFARVFQLHTHSRLGMALIRPLQCGWCGVDLFFALSGFLITGILLDSRSADNYFSSFYMRRMLRIFPLYYGVLLLWFVVLPWVTGTRGAALFGADRQVWFWLYLSNWTDVFGREVRYLGHLWSLAIEEQFYLLWPILVYALSSRRLLHTCVAVCVFALGLRIAFKLAGFPDEACHRLTPARIDTLAAGAIVAVMIRDKSLFPRLRSFSSRRVGIAIGGLLAVTAALSGGFRFSSPVVQTVGYSILATGAAWVIASTTLGEFKTSAWLSALQSAFLRSIGKYSYGMYVFHLILHSAAMDFIAKTPRLAEMAKSEWTFGVAYVLAGVVASYVLAYLSWNGFEKRFLALKSHFSAHRASVSGSYRYAENHDG